MWLQYRLPCRHNIAGRLRAKEKLTLQDLDPRWLLDAAVDRAERYLRIRDPNPAESRRGRPRNEEVPVEHKFNPQNNDQDVCPATSPAAPATPAARGGRGGRAAGRGGRGGRGRGRTLGPPSGTVASGWLSQSIRRRRSQFEMEPSPEVEVVEQDEQPVRRTARQRRPPARVGSRRRRQG
jgi:hypothetical protein